MDNHNSTKPFQNSEGSTKVITFRCEGMLNCLRRMVTVFTLASVARDLCADIRKDSNGTSDRIDVSHNVDSEGTSEACRQARHSIVLLSSWPWI
jgi:hypothetical protein